MFFEGAEKRIKLKCSSNMKEIYNKGWWEHHIKDIGCNILSMISNNHYDIYLLSESILLVGSKKIIIKTCGITSPLEVLKIIDKKYIKDIIYSNPIFLRPEDQPILYQNTYNILKYIEKYIKMPLLCNNKLFINMVASNYETKYNELILWEYNWSDDFIGIIYKYLSDWKLDDYKFEPQGYSLNGCKNKQYITIHSTPNEECSYLSIEFNKNINIDMLNEILLLLKPNKVGLITTNMNVVETLKYNKQSIENNFNDYIIKYYS
jgi:S-adenosylmethionine decarboxylase